MPMKGQKGDPSQELIKEFNDLKTAVALKQWEKLYSDRLAKASPEVKDAFDKHWNKLIGSSYYIARTAIDIPTLQQPQLPGRIDPKSQNYRVERVFHTIRWRKDTVIVNRNTDRERTYYTYQISGEHNHGNSRIIANNCMPDRLDRVLNEELANKIRRAKKSETKGEITDLELPLKVEGHWEVRFAGKATPEDKEDVELQHEGNCLQMQREVPLILPGFYIALADDATHPLFRKVGSEPRKIVGYRQLFPFSVLREATEKEFRIQKEEGDRITALERKREQQG